MILWMKNTELEVYRIKNTLKKNDYMYCKYKYLQGAQFCT